MFSSLIIVNVNVTKIYAAEMSNMRDLWLTGVIFSTSKYSKTHFRPGLRPGPRWESLRRSPRLPSRLGRRLPIPFPSTPSASRSRRLRRFSCQAFQHKFLATPTRPVQCLTYCSAVASGCTCSTLRNFSTAFSVPVGPAYSGPPFSTF